MPPSERRVSDLPIRSPEDDRSIFNLIPVRLRRDLASDLRSLLRDLIVLSFACAQCGFVDAVAKTRLIVMASVRRIISQGVMPAAAATAAAAAVIVTGPLVYVRIPIIVAVCHMSLLSSSRRAIRQARLLFA